METFAAIGIITCIILLAAGTLGAFHLILKLLDLEKKHTQLEKRVSDLETGKGE